MQPLDIQFLAPTGRAIERMKLVLFRPFDMGKWFVLGFTAWLATLMDGSTSNANNASDVEGDLETVGDWLSGNPGAILLTLTIAAIVLALVVLMLWLSSRGKFMFLDNVVHNRARVKEPWARFKVQGDSLFWWMLVFSAAMVALVLLIGGAFVWSVWINPGAVGLVVWIPLALLAVLLVFAAMYVVIVLEDFVIPLMYRNGSTTMAAWRTFMALHRTAVGSFVLFALWKTLLTVLMVVVLMLFGFGTCCVGFILMLIPVVGATLLLPLHVSFRCLGPEFLAQFGEAYRILPETEEQLDHFPTPDAS